MTRSIVSRPLRLDSRPVAKPARFKLLPNVANPRAERTGWHSVFLVVLKEVRVGNQHRATSARVGDNGRVAFAKGIDILPRQRAGAIQLAGMRMQCPATNLP